MSPNWSLKHWSGHLACQRDPSFSVHEKDFFPTTEFMFIQKIQWRSNMFTISSLPVDFIDICLCSSNPPQIKKVFAFYLLLGLSTEALYTREMWQGPETLFHHKLTLEGRRAHSTLSEMFLSQTFSRFFLLRFQNCALVTQWI